MNLRLESLIFEDGKEKKEAVKESINKLVIVKDGHYSWLSGEITYYDNEVYRLKGKRLFPYQLHYHDLERMLVVKNYDLNRTKWPLYLDIENVKIGRNEDEKIRAVKENNGRFAIVGDEHHFWWAGKIEYLDNEVYILRVKRKDRELRLPFHYHDLTTMLIVKEQSRNGENNEALLSKAWTKRVWTKLRYLNRDRKRASKESGALL